MGNAAGQLPQRIELLGFRKLFLHALPALSCAWRRSVMSRVDLGKTE